MKKERFIAVFAVIAIIATGCGTQKVASKEVPAQAEAVADAEQVAADDQDTVDVVTEEVKDLEDVAFEEATEAMNGDSATVSDAVKQYGNPSITEAMNGLCASLNQGTYVYEQTLESGFDGSPFTERYEVILLDDTTAKLLVSCVYSGEKQVSVSQYEGGYTKTDDKLVVTYKGMDYELMYTFVLSGDFITEVLFGDLSGTDTTEIAGTYTGTAQELGHIELVISTDGKANVSTASGKNFEGYIYLYNDDWNLTFYNDEENYDWMVTFDGDTFTWQGYLEYRYAAYAGTYDMVGDLGDMTMYVEMDGTATIETVINGMNIAFSGSINVYDTDMSGAYLVSDEGYVLDLQINYLTGDEVWNYSGSYSIPLGCG